MSTNKVLSNTILIILYISSLSGFLIEEGIFPIDRSILNLVLDSTLLIIGILSFQNNKQNRQLLIIIVAFLIITIFAFILNEKDVSLVIYFNGLREFIPYFLFPIIFINILESKQRSYFIKNINKFLHFFLALQIPIVLYQFSLHGAGDMVGGTLGSGYSGILTIIIFISTFYLIMYGLDKNKLFQSIINKSYLFIFWLPVFVNETKIAFILIILFFVLLMKFSLFNIWKNIFIGISLFFLLYTFNVLYDNATGVKSKEYFSEDFLESYLTSDDENYTDIPRFQKLVYYLTNFESEEILLGKGVGQFKGGTNINVTKFAAKYDWLLSGSRPMLFFLLVQVGVIGTLIFIMYWLRIVFLYPNNLKVNHSYKLILFTSSCFILIQLYNDSFRSLFLSGIILYCLCYAVIPKKLTLKEKYFVNEYQKRRNV